MDKKKLTLLIVGGILALVVLTVLIVGIFEGIWPWDGPKAYAKIFRSEPAQQPAATEPAPQTPAGDATEPSEEAPIPGNQGTSVPTPTTGNPVFDGESTTGKEDVKEEVELPGQTEGTTGGGEETPVPPVSGEDGNNTGNQDPTADANLAGNKVPGWGN